MWRAFRAARAQFRLCVLQALQYRVQFWTEGVLGLAWSLLGVVPLLIAVEQRGAVAGWGWPALIVLTGVFTVISGVFGALIQPSLAETMAHIRRGSFDYLLLRPVDGMISAVTCMYNPWRLLEVVVGACMIAVGLSRQGGDVSAAAVGEGVALLMMGISLLYALGILVVAASFRALRLENLTFLLESLLDFGRWPIGVFRGLVKAALTFIFPLAVLTTFPAEAMLGRFGGTRDATLLVAISVTVVFWIAARLAWRGGVRSYTSASS